MRICIDVTPLGQDRITGVQRVALELSRALVLANTSHEFVLFALVPRANRPRLLKLFEDLPPTVKRMFIPLPKRLFFPVAEMLQYSSLPVELIVGKIDIFHTFDWFTFNSLAKSTSFIFDLTCQKFPRWHTKENTRHQLQRVEKALTHNEHFFVLSKATQKDFLEFYGKKKRTTVIYPGLVGVNATKQDLKTLGIRRPYFLCVGTNEPRKNLKRLVTAYLSLKEMVANAPQLVLVGGGTKKLSQEGIIGLDYANEHSLHFLYTQALALVYPSLYEGFGLPIIEGLAAGTLVVTSENSSLPEAGGKAAFYCDPRDVKDITKALTAVIQSDSRELQRRRKLGKQHALRFSYFTSAEMMISIWENL